MPNRIIKESICTSESISNLSWFEQSLFFRLIVSADDFGIYDARPAVIRGKCFPLSAVTEKNITDALSKLQAEGMIIVYKAEGKPFLKLTSWESNQQIRAKKSKYPLPPKDCENNHLQSIDINCNQVNANVPVIQSNPIQSESECVSKHPTPEEVTAYSEGRIDGHHFVDYYQAQGWKLSNGQPMKDWKAAVRNWLHRDKDKKTEDAAKGKLVSDSMPDEIDALFDDALKKMYGDLANEN